MLECMPIFIEIAGKMNSNTEISTLLPNIVEIVKQYMGVKRVSIFLIEDRKLVLKAHAGFSPEREVIKDMGEGITGRVALTGDVYVVNRLSSNIKEDMGYNASSFLSLPVISKDTIIGVLNLTDKFDDFFDENDIKMAQYIATQCAFAIERSNLYEEMKGTERLRAIGVLRASVAHDIKNLLGIVEVYLALMENTKEPAANAEYIEAIRQEINRVQGIADDIMEYSKQRMELRYSSFDLNEVCKDVAKQMNLALSFSNTRLVFNYAGKIMLNADKEKLFRMIFNLTNNAVQAIPESKKGRIVIETRDLGENISISVCDNGQGMDKDTLKSIFDPFVTGGKPRGTGLGLAIVKEVVNAHKGVIRVRSCPQFYSIFRVLIPKDGQNV